MEARPDQTSYFLYMAMLVATRGTCCRRKVGCVLTNERNHVLATGYNGVPSGFKHCNIPGQECEGAKFPSGQGLEFCEAIHAEQNALLQCPDVYKIDTCYCTTAPCVTCTKLLLNTSCKTIIFEEDYPQAEKAKTMWLNAGRSWLQVEPIETTL
jgi:dCMP deaminase